MLCVLSASDQQQILPEAYSSSGGTNYVQHFLVEGSCSIYSNKCSLHLKYPFSNSRHLVTDSYSNALCLPIKNASCPDVCYCLKLRRKKTSACVEPRDSKCQSRHFATLTLWPEEHKAPWWQPAQWWHRDYYHHSGLFNL